MIYWIFSIFFALQRLCLQTQIETQILHLTDVSPHHLFIHFFHIHLHSVCMFVFVRFCFFYSFSFAFGWPSLLLLASLVQMQSCCYPTLLHCTLLPEGLCVKKVLKCYRENSKLSKSQESHSTQISLAAAHSVS